MNPFKMCRENAGFTQKEVAVDLKVSVQAVSFWENGDRMPTYEKLFQLADLYGVTLDVLLGRDVNVDSISKVPAFSQSKITLSEFERSLILAYRSVSRDTQRAVCNVLGIEAESVAKAN